MDEIEARLRERAGSRPVSPPRQATTPPAPSNPTSSENTPAPAPKPASLPLTPDRIAELVARFKKV
jgi:hypothetical protein